MKNFLITSLVLCAGLNQATAKDELPPTAPPYFRIHYAGVEGDGELAYGVSYTLWLPPHVATIRGLIVHQHGCGTGACEGGRTAAWDLHWQALAARHQCGLLGPSYEQPEAADCRLWCDARHGSDTRFRQALHELAAQTSHPELTSVPWALWGHSGGGMWAGTMLLLHPDRVAAAWLRSGTPVISDDAASRLPPIEIPAEALRIPIVCNLGTEEGVTVTDGRFAGVWPRNKMFFETLRNGGGLIAIAVDPHSSHDCGNSRYLAIPWFDACLRDRLPNTPGEPLKAMPLDRSWLAPLLSDRIVPAAELVDAESGTTPLNAVWLPDEHVARLYAHYVTSGDVPDETPPPPPDNVMLDGRQLSWDAVADFESGIAGFVIERDGTEVARLPQTPGRNIGRSVFQRTSYHDTPAYPLESAEFTLPATTDTTAPGQVSVRTINSVGLISEPALARTKSDRNAARPRIPIPDKVVVLTFDDSARSHFTIVRPILLEHGFNATFFITEGFDFRDNKRDYMTWEEIARLHRDGFEIGNHTRDHLGISDANVPRLAEQLEAIAEQCRTHGIPAPVTFAWPGNATSELAFPILQAHGIRFARRGGAPEFPYDQGRGFAYEPGQDHPLLLPSAGDARPDWTLPQFIQAAEQARDGRIAILQFHGVPDTAHDWVSTQAQNFSAYMKYLKLNGYQVLSLRDLEGFENTDDQPDDPQQVIRRRQQQLAAE